MVPKHKLIRFLGGRGRKDEASTPSPPPNDSLSTEKRKKKKANTISFSSIHILMNRKRGREEQPPLEVGQPLRQSSFLPFIHGSSHKYSRPHHYLNSLLIPPAGHNTANPTLQWRLPLCQIELNPPFPTPFRQRDPALTARNLLNFSSLLRTKPLLSPNLGIAHPLLAPPPKSTNLSD
ncbi:hypothetical protein CEXT_340201 [Caerostris extrusa]|uniref:Uncharacterized protein n=1 Tax=Caerostris extrusa TaxID=172846 RepID=A0AAV4TZR1_CAEEX|nr:hypothetical protein CEXT_340201 [Caerostris extrusa]